ncbi:MAG: hypothetical protein JWQ01_2558 [Massilia sp.]|nr:hypothetical protein [Massilia sp.]
MTAPLYQCLLFGGPTPDQIKNFASSFSRSMSEFGLNTPDHFFLECGINDDFVETVPTVAVFFGSEAAEFPEHPLLIRLNIPVIPLVSTLERVPVELPHCLRSINALALDSRDEALVKPVGVALQCLGLLHSQRRVFISYRRAESREVAVQLFESLATRHFDVFLDTHSVGAAVDFQSVLWHRLCDSDVVVMLDTPGFFESRWAKVEWGRATDKHISILQVLWPGHVASRFSALATPMALTDADFAGAVLIEDTAERIAMQVEVLRSKSTALRHANIAGHLRAAIESMGGAVEGYGARRSLVMKLPSGAALVAHPSVGVPSAVTLHEAVADGDTRASIVVYDHVGISEQWMTHLGWLGENFTSVKWIRSRQAGWELAELDGV